MQIYTSRIPNYTLASAMIITLGLASKRHKTYFPFRCDRRSGKRSITVT
jgi:hypothetical protein